jgi:hypothetical protein
MELIMFTPNAPVSFPANVMTVHAVMIEIMTYKLLAEEKSAIIDSIFKPKDDS